MTETGYDPAAAITEALKDMTPEQAVKMARELCAQLSGDAEGFHGNIWPDNIRLDWEGKAVLGEPSDVPANRREAEQVEYLAPEYFWDNDGSAAADVYSLGMLLFAACSGGYLPFQPKGGLITAKDRSGALRKRMKGEAIQPPSHITPALAAVIKKSLAYEPEDRYISAAELLHALSETDEALPSAAAESEAEKESPEWESEDAEGEAVIPAPEIPLSGEVPLDNPDETSPKDAEADNENLPETDDTNPSEAAPEESGESEGAETPEPVDSASEEDSPGEPDINDILEAELSFLHLPNAEDETVSEPEPEPASVPKYTVQKDFDEKPSVPAANRKKRSSPLIPILCVAAVVIIAVAAVILQGRSRPAAQESAEEAVTYTIEPVLATSPPEPAEVTPSLGDDTDEPDAEAAGEDAEAEEEAEAGVNKGSASIDGLTVEPADDMVEISDTGANLRIGPGTNYRVAESLPRGTILTRTGTVNGWSQVQYNGEEYYVASNLVFRVEQPAAPAATPSAVSGDTEIFGAIVVTADVNIRSGPGTDYAKVGEAKVGASLTPLGRSSDGKWYHISYNGTEGYVNRNLISVQNYAEVAARSGTLTVERDVNLRSGPGTGYAVLGTGSTGDSFTLTGQSDNGWYRIDYDGQTAYLAGDYASVK